jgi:hypothetical protein
MKKLIILLILFIVSIPAFAQDEPLFAENFSLIKDSGDNIQSFFSLDIESPDNYLFDIEKKGHSKQYQAFQTPGFQQFSERVHLLRFASIENREWGGEKPPLRGDRILGEILAGGALGFALGLGGAYLGTVIDGGDVLHGGLWGAIIGGSLGFSIGSALGVYIIGSIGDETGSIGATFRGSILGMGLAWVAILLRTPLAYISIAAPPILACIGFNNTRRYKSKPASGTALLNFREGQMNLGIPTVYFQPDAFGRRALNMNISLMNAEF